MRLIGVYRNAGTEVLSDIIMEFFDRRADLWTQGLSFASDPSQETPAKRSTDIGLVALGKEDPEARGLADVILRAASAGLQQYSIEHPLFVDCCPERSLFVCPLFNLQRYAPGEGFYSWHCDWTTQADATEPHRRVLAWILYCNTLPEGGTEFHWQNHHEQAEKGKLLIFPAGLSHIHRGRISQTHGKTIATGWINAGTLDGFLERLARD
jgi:hypothetical protein